MQAPAVKGYRALCVTPRSQVCDEQGVGLWPMWQRFDKIEAIVNQYIEEPYRDFLARPEYEKDEKKPEEYFFWYTPRTDAVFSRLSNSGDDHDYYREILNKTLSQYYSAVEKLKSEGNFDDANFLQLSLKYAGDSEQNVYCGDGRVVATVWGMRPRQGHDNYNSKLEAELFPPTELHTVQYELGNQGSTSSPTSIRKSHGTQIYAHQVPQVTAADGYEFIGWDRNPIGTIVNNNLLFTAEYRKRSEEKKAEVGNPKVEKHHVRFLTPDSHIIKEIDIEHGKQIPAGFIPPMPAVDNVVCPAWDGDPLNDIITADRDYKAISPAKPEALLHTVRFLTPNGDEMCKFDVEHGTQLTQAQVPPLPVVDGMTCAGWNANPLMERITSDRDFVAKLPEKKAIGGSRGGCLSAIINWLLLLLGLLLLLLLFWCFIFDKCNFNFCGCNCDKVERIVIVNPEPIINDGDKLPEPAENCGVHFSGLVLSDVPSQDGIAVIFGDDPMGEYVGRGYYPDNSKAFPKAVQHSFDAIAVDKGTRLIIYRKPNFEGDVLLDVVGPALITNVLWKDDVRYNKVANKEFNSSLQALFPPSKRQWSSENMHGWSYGSCKIICQQCK